MKFFDDNTRSWWTPVTGGANVPALNELLAPHGVALGDAIVQGSVSVGAKAQQVSVRGAHLRIVVTRKLVQPHGLLPTCHGAKGPRTSRLPAPSQPSGLSPTLALLSPAVTR